MRNAFRAWAVCLLGLLVVSCATSGSKPDAGRASTADAPIPSYLRASTGCAVIAGGGVGSEFADKKIEGFWRTVNAEVTGQLYNRLARDGYKVVKLIIPTERAPDYPRLVIETVAKSRCNRLLQVSHAISEDSAGRYFRFDVSLIRFQPKGDRKPGDTGTHTVTASEFSRQYRFPRSAEGFAKFHTGTFAETVFTDLKKSGKLASVR